MRCPARWCSEPSSATGAISRPAAATKRRAFAMATAPTRLTSGATSARSFAWASGSGPRRPWPTSMPTAGRAGWNQWAEVVVRDAREPRFLGDMPHGWVASDQIRSVLDLFAYEDEGESSLVLAAGVPMAWLRGKGLSIRDLRTPWGRLSWSARVGAERRHRHPCVRPAFLSARWRDVAGAVGQERSSDHRWPDHGRAGRRHSPLASAGSRSGRTAISLSHSLEMVL